MKSSDGSGVKARLSFLLMVGGIVIFAYLFSTGPVTRWNPTLAETLYAPLAPIAQNTVMGRPLRAWLRVWGVNAVP